MPDGEVRQTVLVVDDEPDILEVVSRRLKAEGFQVLTAKNGAEAVEAAKAHHPGTVLLDIMMPVMDGYQALKALKADPATADIPVIMLSAKVSDKDVALAMELGSVYFMMKPHQPKELVQEVRTAIQRHQVTHARR
jgi:DNA-binding response OmpR family regulator